MALNPKNVVTVITIPAITSIIQLAILIAKTSFNKRNTAPLRISIFTPNQPSSDIANAILTTAAPDEPNAIRVSM